MIVKFKKLHPAAVLPSYAKPGDAGLDLTSRWVRNDVGLKKSTHGTNIAVEIPEGYVGLVYPRSSVHLIGCRLANSVGVIDSGYRGEIVLVFDIQDDDTWLVYAPGDRIAQLVIVPIPTITVVEAEELSESERGTGSFGSSGK